MIGIVLIVIGYFLRLWAVITNKQFTLKVETPQYFVQNGPYAIVRHPAYLGSLLVASGVGLALTNWQNTVLPVIVLYTLLSARAIEEERLIEAAYPHYLKYRQRVGMFFPKVKVNYVVRL